jgi:hypothetical protein
MSLNYEIVPPISFSESIKNDIFGMESRTGTLWRESHSHLKYGIADMVLGTLWVCVKNPRNDIDNPITYCTQPFYTKISSLLVASILKNLSKGYQGIQISSWNIFSQLEEKLENRIQYSFNVPPGYWEWPRRREIPTAEYYVLAYMIGSISAEKAIELSGLSEIDFAAILREKAQERDLPIFDAYLKGEAVEDQLPFSEEASIRFKDLMAKEIE